MFLSRSFERTTPIFFEKIVTKGGPDTFMEDKPELFQKANSSCPPSVIRMGRELSDTNLQQHVAFFRQNLVGLPSRLPSIYSCYRFFAEQVNALLNIVSLRRLNFFWSVML